MVTNVPAMPVMLNLEEFAHLFVAKTKFYKIINVYAVQNQFPLIMFVSNVL